MSGPLASLTFEAEVIHWRGPSPFFFAAVPSEQADALREAARSASYGWGMIPVDATLHAVTFTTALFPKDGTYYLPLKDAVRARADVSTGSLVTIGIVVRPRTA